MMMKWVWVACLISFGVLYSVVAQDTVKIIRLKNQPIIEGTINGKKAYFLVDTGSDITMLDEGSAKKYNFEYREESLKDYQITGLGSKHRGKTLQAYNVKLYLGTQKIQTIYRVFDLENIATSMSIGTGIRINGIIGSDLMKRYGFVINYNTREITFNYK